MRSRLKKAKESCSIATMQETSDSKSTQAPLLDVELQIFLEALQVLKNDEY